MFFLFTKHMKLCPFWFSNIYIRCLNPFGKKFAFNAISVQLKKILLLQTCTCTIVFFSFLVNDTFLPHTTTLISLSHKLQLNATNTLF